MKVKEAVRRESSSLGRKVEILDYARLKGNVLTVVLRSYGAPHEGLGSPMEIRVVTYAGDRMMYSAIVGTKWYKD